MTSQAGAENATLTAEELAACQPAGSGTQVRAFCPFHGSDHQRSLAVNLETGRFHCFQCGAWGYTAEARQRWRTEHGHSQGGALADRTTVAPPAVILPKTPEPARGDLLDLMVRYLLAWDTRLGKRLGADYLRRRGIPLDLAIGYRLGYAEPGRWAHVSNGRSVRDWKWGRVVFPHEAPDGTLLNLYGRAVDNDAWPAGDLRHDHLPGNKGYFNATCIRDGTGPLCICEGPFDALSVIAAGHRRTVAIFGVNGWRWDWARTARELVFVLDADATGQEAWRKLARAARLRGKDVYVVPPEAFGGHKDANAAWAAGVLDLTDPLGGAQGPAPRTPTAEVPADQSGPRPAPHPARSTAAQTEAAFERAVVLFEAQEVVSAATPGDDRGPVCRQHPRRLCYCCGGRRYWTRGPGGWVCAVCHPSALPHMVVQWIEVKAA